MAVAGGLLIAAGPAFARDDAALSGWFDVRVMDAANGSPAVNDTRLDLVGKGGPHSAIWTVFDPIALQTGKPVTLSCRIKTPDDIPTNSTSQIRIGLYGVLNGVNPSTTKQSDLRGFVLMAGSAKTLWRLDLAEHDRATGGLIVMAGMTNRAMTTAESRGGRGADARIVITFTKKSADAVVLNGFWGDVPFSFDVQPFAGEITHLRAVAVMRGNTSGDGAMAISDVKVRAD